MIGKSLTKDNGKVKKMLDDEDDEFIIVSPTESKYKKQHHKKKPIDPQMYHKINNLLGRLNFKKS